MDNKINSPLFDKDSILTCITLFILTFIIYNLTRDPEPTVYNNFIRLADAFLNGRLHLLSDSPWLELVHMGGKHYVVPPPMPAILSIPAVAVWGIEADQTLISIFFGSVNVPLAYLIARSLTGNKSVQLWSAVMFGFGTIHFWLATTGSVWTFSQTVSVTFLFIAILLTLHNRSSFLTGLSLGASYWSRLTTVLSLPFFLIYNYKSWYQKTGAGSFVHRLKFNFLVKLALGLGVFIVLNGLYNYLRFETPFDVSYYLLPGILEEPDYQKGIFDISYIPRHINMIFLKFPQYVGQFPYLLPSHHGLSIWITTPAFVYALWAGMRNKIALGCWVSIILIALAVFLHGTWGFTQFGYRFAVDFYPFLFILTVMGIGEKIRWHHIALIVIGILVNLWGIWVIRIYGWEKIITLIENSIS